MESAIFGLIGVVLGSVLTGIKEWWFKRLTRKKESEYLAIRIVCMLERYVNGCEMVIGDDGLNYGQRDRNGCRVIQVSTPKFEPESVEVEWKSLPADLMYEVLNFSIEIEVANIIVNTAFEYVASPPDYEEGFKTRQYQYAQLRTRASNLASKLREHASLMERPSGDLISEVHGRA